MTLFTATLVIAIFLILKGVIWISFPKRVQEAYTFILRSSMVSYILFGLASIWVLCNIAHLGESDFGQYRHWLLLLFGAVALGCFLYLKDFLMVRGWAILALLIAKILLDAAYMQAPLGRLFLVVFAYLLILEALYFGAVPYKMRDLTHWIFAKRSRINQFALGFITYGILLIGATFTY